MICECGACLSFLEHIRVSDFTQDSTGALINIFLALLDHQDRISFSFNDVNIEVTISLSEFKVKPEIAVEDSRLRKGQNRLV